MRKFTKLIALAMAGCMAAAAFAGCTDNNTGSSNNSGNDKAKGKVYFLNFKPEQDEQWKALAKKYTDEKGVDVKVVTAAAGTYETTLKSEIAKTDAPTLFQVNGPVGLASWKDKCYDLKDTELVKQISSDDFILKDGDKVAAASYVIETYGLIYNKKLLNDYIKTDGAKIKSADEINSFAKLKEVAEDIQAKKADLGIDGAFTSAGMDESSDWRFKTHLANLPIYYEYKADNIGTTDAIKGTYLDNYKNIWDLYINNATCEKTMISSKTGEDANSEFATGKAVFFQNGTWAYGDVKGKDVADDDMGMLPIYIGGPGEENQGLCTGTENYWCVNKDASEADIKATIDFMNWCTTSDTGVDYMAKELGFIIPVKNFPDKYLTTNPLLVAADESVKAGKTPVSWNFPTMPSEKWKNGVGSALLEYAQGTGNWDAVKTAFVDGWKTEAAAAKS